MVKNCARCGALFTRNCGAHKFCSAACRLADTADRAPVALGCPGCGNAFHRHVWEVERGAKYCSHACYQRASVGKPRVRKTARSENRCLVCGAAFEVGGRGGPKKDALFCSVPCRLAGRYRNGSTAAMLTEVQAAYLAGLVDGEGSIMLNPRAGGSITSRVVISNTHRGVLDWVAETTGIGNVQAHRPQDARHRAGWMWVTNGDGALSLLEQIRPYMIIKTEQADLAVEAQRRLRDPSTKTGAWQMEYSARVSDLNRRGPR